MTSLTTSTSPQTVAWAEVRQPRRSGRWLLVISIFLVAAAAFRELRLELGGLLIPLHLMPIIVAVPLVFPRLRELPANVTRGLVAFLAMFFLAMLQHGSDFGELVKMAASIGTIIAVALLVGSRRDFLVGATALTVAMLIINVRGLQGGFVDYVGYEPLRGVANKNAYSLYALPALLISGFVLLHFSQSLATKVLHITLIVSSVFILFNGANRSGWGGVVFIAIVLAVQARRWRSLIAILALSGISYVAFEWLGTSSTFDYRVEQTTAGYGSDDLRENLLVAALEVAAENPLLGVSPQQLPFELAKRTSAEADVVDPHNFIGYILGGCGVLTMLALLFTGLALWKRPASVAPPVRRAHDLLRMVVLVFVVRGLFSREVFYVAAFPIALGLALGLMLVEENEALGRRV